MLQWKIFMVLALIGHVFCGISDCLLTYAPNGKVDLTNFKDYEKSKQTKSRQCGRLCRRGTESRRYHFGECRLRICRWPCCLVCLP